MLHALVEIQSELIRGGATRPLLDRFLTLLLEATGGTHGFIGELHPTPGQRPRLEFLASHPASWVEHLRELPPALLQTALETGQPVSSSQLWVLPLRSGDNLLGVAGISHPQGDLAAERLSRLMPLLTTGANLLMGWRSEQRRRAQEESYHRQLANLEQLKQALASVEDGLWEWHLPTQTLHLSHRWRELLGYAEGELEPTTSKWMSLCHPEDLPEVDRLIRAHLNGSSPFFEFAYRARRKNGEWAWILSRARVVARDGQGNPVRVMGTDLDITARKSNEERLAALIRAIPDLLFRMRVDGTFIDWNDGSPEPTALPPEVFLGKKVQDLPLPRPFSEVMLAHVQRVIREGTLVVYEYELEARGRGMQRYEARIVASGPDEALVIARNITERKLVEERQGQLIRAEKLASLGQLAAGIAHEINNPVGYVMSNLKTLEQQAAQLVPLLKLQRELLEADGSEPQVPSAEQLARLREVWKQADVENLLADLPEVVLESLTGARRIKEIVQSLRAFSREDDNKPQVVDLNAELESTLRMVWNELKYKCEVKRDFGALPFVTCYPTQITQVFTNLLVNAAQAIDTQGEIHIRTRQQGDEVVVEISDTGKGMTQETLSRLFTPFFTTKPRGHGTGLGLSISRDIIARHGGRIEVQSEPGRGSTFTIYLPVGSKLPPLSE